MGTTRRVGNLLSNDPATQAILDSISADMVVTWVDCDTGIKIKASQIDMITVLFQLSLVLQSEYFVSVKDFLLCFDDASVQVPDDVDKEDLKCGWSISCFDCWTGSGITIECEATVRDGEGVFEFCFVPRWCTECKDCDGCDSYADYKYLENCQQNQTSSVLAK